MQPLMHDPAVSKSITEFNKVNRIELLRNMTIINVLSRYDRPLAHNHIIADTSDLISKSNYSKSTPENFLNRSLQNREDFNQLIDRNLKRHLSALIKDFKVLDNGKAVKLDLA